MWHMSVRVIKVLPGIGAVVIKRLEVFSGDEFAPVHARLNGSESAQDPHLLHRAHHRTYIQPLQLGVDGVQPTDQVLQEQVKHLRETDELLTVHGERGYFHPVHLHHLTLVVINTAGAVAVRAAAARAGDERVDHAAGQSRGLGRAGVQRVGTEEAARAPGSGGR